MGRNSKGGFTIAGRQVDDAVEGRNDENEVLLEEGASNLRCGLEDITFREDDNLDLKDCTNIIIIMKYRLTTLLLDLYNLYE